MGREGYGKNASKGGHQQLVNNSESKCVSKCSLSATENLEGIGKGGVLNETGVTATFLQHIKQTDLMENTFSNQQM